MATKDDEGIFNTLSKIIDDAFSKVFNEKKESSSSESLKYSNIEEYTEQTGKRFRMTKDQKERGLTREEAFTELHLNEEK